MNFDYSEDQKFLKEEARRFLTAHVPASKVRDLLVDPARGHDAELWDAIVAQGWLGTAIPEAYGGLGLGYVELCALAEEMGRVLAPVPFDSTIFFFAEALLIAGSEEQKQALLPLIASGEAVGCIAIAERAGPVRAADIQASVSGGRLTGVKLPVTDGMVASHALVLATEDGAPSLFIVALDKVGRERLDVIDPSRGAARLSFDGVPAQRLGGAGEGMALLERLYRRAAVPIAFEQLGGAQRCLEMARDFALGRYAFGRQIAGFQAIKHKLADMYTRVELARSHAYYGAWALAQDAPELPLAAAAARVSACDAFWVASKENNQIHGGMGFTWEADPQLYYKRSRHLGLIAGPARRWMQVLAVEIERREAA